MSLYRRGDTSELVSVRLRPCESPEESAAALMDGGGGGGWGLLGFGVSCFRVSGVFYGLGCFSVWSFGV